MLDTVSRRNFLKTASTAAMAMSAASYSRIAGANDRISIGVIGCGSRGRGAHMTGVNNVADKGNAEITAVCDPWRVSREAAVDLAKDWYGREPRQFGTYKDLLALDDVDAVMIASCDHQHTTHLKAAAEAKKDVYVEKPLSKDMPSLIAAVDAVKANGVVCQVGTQLRSMPSMTGAREVYRSGILGKVARIEQCRNESRPYWYSYVKDAKEEDVDWAEFLMDCPMRPFDPAQFTGWYGHREFSDGPVPGLASHFIDLVHYITGTSFPVSCVSMGGTFTWKDDYKFDAPDQQQALWTYPEGFMVTYSTNFGNGAAKSFKILGDQGLMDLEDWSRPFITPEGAREPNGKISGKTPVEEVEMPDHILDWLQCIRSRETPNASIDAGYQHGVAVLMAMRAYDTGKRQIYDPEKREFREG